MKTLLVSIILLPVALCAQPHAPRILSLEPALAPFYHGVASGDPRQGRVILWTRVTPDSAATGPITVDWKVGTDTLVTQVVLSGSTTTDDTKDYTVKVDAIGLSPNTFYYYQFEALGKKSIIGRTKTAPTGDVDSLRFAIVSCANYEAGYFNAYAAITPRNDIDAILHLGDYIYEYETGGYSPNSNTPDRIWAPGNEILTLSDYRTRYSHYHLDSDLRRLHQQYPMINIWDDHETANNSYKDGAENHTPGTEGNWQDRKAAGMRAFNEWLPIREDAGLNDTVIYRRLPYGDLLDLYMLDTRLYGREVQDGTSNNDTNRTMLGAAQFTWLKNQLSAGSAQWNIIGQQVMMAPLKAFGLAVNDDQWDGYPAERSKFYDHILSNNIHDIVVLTGDIHTSWANNLRQGSVPTGVEFVGTSVTSPGLTNLAGLSTGTIQLFNDHIEFVDLAEHGFVLLDVNKQRTVGEWYFVPTLDTPSDQVVHETSWKTDYGTRVLSTGGAPVPARPSLAAPFAPDPTLQTSVAQPRPEALVLGVYPNPAQDYITVRFYSKQGGDLKLSIGDLTGKSIVRADMKQVVPGTNYTDLNLSELPAGIYILTISGNGFTTSKKIVKN